LTLPQLQKLRGLLTFGSPLDKIYYFFREHVKEDQAIRAQILSIHAVFLSEDPLGAGLHSI